MLVLSDGFDTHPDPGSAIGASKNENGLGDTDQQNFVSATEGIVGFCSSFVLWYEVERAYSRSDAFLDLQGRTSMAAATRCETSRCRTEFRTSGTLDTTVRIFPARERRLHRCTCQPAVRKAPSKLPMIGAHSQGCNMQPPAIKRDCVPISLERRFAEQ